MELCRECVELCRELVEVYQECVGLCRENICSVKNVWNSVENA